MSARILFLLALFVAAFQRAVLAADAGAEKFAPTAPDISHYEQIWKRSPFIVETVAVMQSPGLATKYGLVGIVGSGKDSVAFLVDRNESDPVKSRLMLSQSSPDKPRNLSLVSISLDTDMAKSSVVIKQGSEQATLPFDPATLSGAGVGVRSTGAMPGSPIPPPPGGMMPPNADNAAVPLSPGQRILAPNPTGIQMPPTPTRRIIRPKPINVN